MERTFEVLHEFASNARMTEAERADLSTVAKKYLAVQVNIVPTHISYACIDNDYRLVSLRVQNPPIAQYQSGNRLDVDAFVFIARNGFSATKEIDNPVFQYFRKEVFPRPIGEELWKDCERADKWKEKAAYVALNFRNHSSFCKLCQALGVDQNRLKAYDVKQVDGISMGKVLADLHLEEKLFSKPTNTPKEEQQQVTNEKPTQKVITIKETPASCNLEDLRAEMEDYRKRAGLNVVTNTKRIAQQMICASVGITKTPPVAILGKHQTALPELKDDRERELVSRIIDVVSASEATTKHMNQSVYANAIASTLNQYEWNSVDLVKHVIAPKSCMDGRTYSRFEKSIANAPLANDPGFLEWVSNL